MTAGLDSLAFPALIERRYSKLNRYRARRLGRCGEFELVLASSPLLRLSYNTEHAIAAKNAE
jgi:hypothetical protein